MLGATQEKALRAFAFALVEPLPAYIAGGFAADYTQAGDVDLWILGDPTLEKTAAHLTDLGAKFKHGTRGDSVDVEEIGRSVIDVYTPLLTIHVIGVEETRIQDLLSTFDISTHRWALSRAGTLIAGEGATKPWEPGRVLTYKYPASTDKRRIRLAQRYGIEIAKFIPPKDSKKKDAA